MIIHTINDVDYVHITDFAKATGRLATSTRLLIEKGNVVRRLKSLRIRSALYIPFSEITGFPFSKNGKIYHYRIDEGNDVGERYLCEACTFTNDRCDARIKADNTEVPE